MDRDNKYYSIIENLVKNHRKFPGLESILEDIIDDVYAHSKTIIESITDDNVIDGYLNKVVSTSIITVPKKLNFHNEVKHRSIPVYSEPVATKSDHSFVPEPEIMEQEEAKIEEPANIVEEDLANSHDESDAEDKEFETILAEENVILEESEPEQLDTDEIEPEKTNNTLVDRMINSIAEDTIKENGLSEQGSEETLITEEDDDDILEESTVNYSDVSDFQDLNELQVEDSTTSDEEQIFDIVEENSLEENENIFTDVDEEENVLEETEDLQDITDENEELEAEEPENIEESGFDILETTDELEPEDDATEELSEDNNLDILELSEPDSEEEFDFQEADNTEEPLQIEDELFNDSEEDSDVPEINDLQELDTDTPDTFDLEESEEDTLLEETNIDFDNDLEENNTDSELVLSEEDEQNNNNTEFEFKQVDYSAFNYNPEKKTDNYDSEEIVSKLLDLDNQEPNLNILKVFELKYKQNLTIEEIMAELNIEKQDVIAALDKMVDLI